MYVTKNLCDEKEAHTTQLKKKTAIDLIIHTSHVLWFTRLLCPRNSPGKNTGVGSHFLLQSTFPTEGLNLAGRFFTTEPPGKPKRRYAKVQSTQDSVEHH